MNARIASQCPVFEIQGLSQSDNNMDTASSLLQHPLLVRQTVLETFDFVQELGEYVDEKKYFVFLQLALQALRPRASP